MKIAVGLFGIHYCERVNHWATWTNTVDYRVSLQHQKTNIYSQLPNADIDFYSATYRSDILDDLNNDFQFKKIEFLDFDNTKALDNAMFSRRNNIFRQTVKLILESKELYNYVLLTRYDFHPFAPLNFSKFDSNKVNLICRAKWGSRHNLSDDNFYYLPYTLLPEFYHRISAIPSNVSSHEWDKHIGDIIHYMDESAYYSHELPYYTILRLNLVYDN